MANFISWATDVLEKVDQSAATISDSAVERGKRHKKRSSANKSEGEVEAMASDSQISDYSDYGSDFSASHSQDRGPTGVRYVEGSTLLRSPANNQATPTISPPSTPSSQPHPTSSPPSSSSSSTPLLPAPPATPPLFSPMWVPPLDPASWLYRARRGSVSVETLRAARRRMDGHVWQRTEGKEEWEEELRKTSEVEAKVSVLANEAERLKRASAMSSAFHQQEARSLREDADSAHASLAQERAAHAASLAQSKAREAHLSSENRSFSKALAATQRQTEEKVLEASRMLPRVKELETKKERLEAELADLTRQLAEREAASVAKAPEEEEEEADEAEESGNGAEELCVQKKEELESLESHISQLRSEIEGLRHRWPSTGQREKELERRLRGINEQLLAKQAQAESLSSEKAAMERQLSSIQENVRQMRASDEVADPRAVRAPGRLSAPGSKSSLTNDSMEDDPSGKSRPRSSGRSISDGVARVAQTMDSLSLFAGAALQRHSFARSFIVAYVLGLHLSVFVILSLAAAQRALTGHGN